MNNERHMKNHHPELYKGYKEKMKNEMKSEDSVKRSAEQPTLEDYNMTIKKQKEYVNVKISIEELEYACLVMVTKDGRPLKAVEDLSTKLFLQPYLNALQSQQFWKTSSHRYSMHRKKIRELVMLEADRMRTKISNYLQNKLLCLKVDAATRLGKSYLCINVQLFVNNEFKLFTLGMVRITSQHTGENLKKLIMEVLGRYNIGTMNVYAITTDNGSNMIKCVKIMNNDSNLECNSSANVSEQQAAEENFDDDFEIVEVDCIEFEEVGAPVAVEEFDDEVDVDHDAFDDVSADASSEEEFEFDEQNLLNLDWSAFEILSEITCIYQYFHLYRY